MRNFKKFLALALTMLMLLGAVITTSAQAPVLADAATSDYAWAIQALQAIGIVSGGSDGNYNPDGNLTRWQMTVFASKLVSGITDNDVWTKSKNETTFKDITDDEGQCAGAINYAFAHGLIKGINEEQTLFNPNGNITVQDAITLLVRALGYGFDVAGNPLLTYPEGYINAGADLHLEDNLFFVNYKRAITRGEMAQLVYNALFAPCINSAIYSAIDGSFRFTIAEQVFGLGAQEVMLVKTPSYIMNPYEYYNIDKVQGMEDYVVLATYSDDGYANGDDFWYFAVDQFEKFLPEGATADEYFGISFEMYTSKNGAEIIELVPADFAVLTEADGAIELETEDGELTGNIIINGQAYNPDEYYDVDSVYLDNLGETIVTDECPYVVIYDANSGYFYDKFYEGDIINEFAVAGEMPLYYTAEVIDDNHDGFVDRVFLMTYKYGQYTDKQTTSNGKTLHTFKLGDEILGASNREAKDWIKLAGEAVSANKYIIAAYNYYYDTLTVAKVLPEQSGYVSHAGMNTITIDGKAYNIGENVRNADYATTYAKFYGNDATNVKIWAVGQTEKFIADGDNILDIYKLGLTNPKNQYPVVFDALVPFGDDLYNKDYTKGVKIYAYEKATNGAVTRKLFNVVAVDTVRYNGSAAGFWTLYNYIRSNFTRGEDLFKYTTDVAGNLYLTTAKMEDIKDPAKLVMGGRAYQGTVFTDSIYGGYYVYATEVAPGTISFDSEGVMRLSLNKEQWTDWATREAAFRQLYTHTVSTVLVYSDEYGFMTYQGELKNVTFTGVDYYVCSGVTSSTANPYFDYIYIHLGEGATITGMPLTFSYVYVNDANQTEVYDDGSIAYTDVFDFKSGVRLDKVVVNHSFGTYSFVVEGQVVNSNTVYAIDESGYVIGKASDVDLACFFPYAEITYWNAANYDRMAAYGTVEDEDGNVIAANVLFNNVKAYEAAAGDDEWVLAVNDDDMLNNVVTEHGGANLTKPNATDTTSKYLASFARKFGTGDYALFIDGSTIIAVPVTVLDIPY
ncbi:MAG: S-layer homology domain-containing protein [Clostridia bacterium]|nr:S-layer homology domain-containing protein [Clostridia bacterium]